MSPHLKDYFPEPVDTTFQRNLELEDAYEKERQHGFDFRLRKTLDAMCVPPRIQRSKKDVIPAEILNLVPFQRFPQLPFGLTGPGGCGKSCALIWLVKRFLIEEFNRLGPACFEMQKRNDGFQGIPVFRENAPETKMIWLNWPNVAVTMKHLASRREWANKDASLLELINAMKADPEKIILFIDDFGMENIKGEKSYVQEQLELMIDVAYNYEVKVFWTSNKTFEELAGDSVYGYRMMSRVAGLAPDVALPNSLPDLRARSAYV